MNRALVSLAALLALAIAPALAGGHGCEASTQDCLNQMVKNMKNKGLIGVDGEWSEEAGTYTIKGFIEGSNAEAAGVRIGDALVAVNGIPLKDQEASYADYPNRAPGSEAKITVLRDAKEKEIRVRLIAMSQEQFVKAVGEHMVEHADVKVAKAD